MTVSKLKFVKKKRRLTDYSEKHLLNVKQTNKQTKKMGRKKKKKKERDTGGYNTAVDLAVITMLL